MTLLLDEGTLFTLISLTTYDPTYVKENRPSGDTSHPFIMAQANGLSSLP